MGPGSQCADVSCGCVCGGGETEPDGLGCCYNLTAIPQCSQTTQDECPVTHTWSANTSCNTCLDGGGGGDPEGMCCQTTTSNGVTTTTCLGEDYTQKECSGSGLSWTQNGSCNTCTFQQTTQGICCKDGACDPNATTKTLCDEACGNWISSITVRTQPCGSEGNVVTCNGSEFTYTFGVDPGTECSICALSRPVFWTPGATCGVPSLPPNPASDLFAEKFDANNTFFWKGYNLGFDQSYNCYTRSDGTSADLVFNHKGHFYVLPELVNQGTITQSQLLTEILKVFNTNNSDELSAATVATLRSYFNYIFKPPVIVPIPNSYGDIYIANNWDQYCAYTYLSCQSKPGCARCYCPSNGIGFGLLSTQCKDLAATVNIESSPTISVDLESGDPSCPEGFSAIGVCNPAGGQICTDIDHCICGPGPGGTTICIQEGSGVENVPFEPFSFDLNIWANQQEINPGCPATPTCLANGYTKNAKLIINNQEYCLPILCTTDCDDFETC